MKFSVKRAAGGADTSKQGELIYREILRGLDTGKPFVVDFTGIQTATSSFTNIAFVGLLANYSLGEIKRRLRVVNSTRQINDMIKSRLEREAARDTAA